MERGRQGGMHCGRTILYMIHEHVFSISSNSFSLGRTRYFYFYSVTCANSIFYKLKYLDIIIARIKWNEPTISISSPTCALMQCEIINHFGKINGAIQIVHTIRTSRHYYGQHHHTQCKHKHLSHFMSFVWLDTFASHLNWRPQINLPTNH